MKEQIYQNGFYLLVGLLLGASVTFIAVPKQQKTDVIKIELKQDSAKTVNNVKEYALPKKTAELNEENLRNELKKNNIPHRDIVVAQAKLESGLGTSDVYKRTNNLFGLRKGKKYRKYNHWTDCVADYKECISSKYNGGNYYKFLIELPYAEDPEYIKKLKELVLGAKIELIRDRL